MPKITLKKQQPDHIFVQVLTFPQEERVISVVVKQVDDPWQHESSQLPTKKRTSKTAASKRRAS